MMKENDPEILNAALELATEWGENFHKPIGDRMKARFPGITDGEIGEAEAIAKRAESRIYELAEMEERGQLSESDITRIAAEEFPWLEADHIGRLKNIGMYYARR
ncbi:MAG: hypothetical protein IPM21_09845 [Acidobacteria bacterium]|nr:hypothetical protein [Acidobacteriota bacterium]